MEIALRVRKEICLKKMCGDKKSEPYQCIVQEEESKKKKN